MPKARPLALYSTRHRWTDRDAQTVLAALDASGLSVAAFAGREGIDPQRLYFWRRRLEGTSVATEPPPTFVEVRRLAVDREPIEIVLRSGHIVRVAESVDAAALRRLVDALEQDPVC